ncbi:LuxS/MPP-like metallohydrolase [Gymnopus androsaceus JB14]|uniref:Cytochrome b-c1 complex subunit 2, mitochondrial n=1 Tax=Gymnopus androsaceus JB14 TaxID=1447944 RepID=A0A6A4GST2_9AGAR|nr:LuxS/MPP-like metallohydrolase [Gymnopus androsaceus JB14]
MLVARASSRTVQRVARNFGVKVAAVDNNQPTSSVTFLVKAASRFEPKAGVAHGLKNFAFKSTDKRTVIGTVRESKIYGGVLSASLSRKLPALTAEFLRGDECKYFVDVLTSFVTSSRYTRHELSEVASTNEGFQAVEAAHALAFHSGLGSSLMAPPHNNITVLGTGIDQATLSRLVEKSLSKISTALQLSSSASSYFGGETRLQAHGGPQTMFIGFGSPGAPTPEIAALSAYLSPAPSVKWLQSTLPIAAAIPEGTTVKVVHLPYSDALLFGLLIQGPTGAAVKEAGIAAVQALKTAASGLKAEDLKKAVAKAKFAAASAIDSWKGLVTHWGESSLESALASLNKVSESGFTKTTSALVKAKPVFVAMGDVATLPYINDLGL